MKEQIKHRKPWDTSGKEPEPETIETWYEYRFNRNYIGRLPDGTDIICSDKKRLRRFMRLQEKSRP